MVKICVFDTETSDKSPVLPGKDWNERSKNEEKLMQFSDLQSKESMWGKMLSNWPSILQLSYIIYDTEYPENIKIFNKYIEISDSIIISESAKEVHHIDREKIRIQQAEKKAPARDVVEEFMRDIMNPSVKYIVGHNVLFDIKMIIAEILRMQTNNIVEHLQFLMSHKNIKCTMNLTTNICNLPLQINYKDKKTGEEKSFIKLKSPKLSESYSYYFGHEPNTKFLHDSLVDVIICLRVYIKYKYNEDILHKNQILKEYILQITPEVVRQNNPYLEENPDTKKINSESKKKSKTKSETKILYGNPKTLAHSHYNLRPRNK